ncbi:MAG TPA: EamA family transporter [Gemmatimonadales bacterium]|nr:EamA family transporter [Gemmatimonadales bacterium]
MQAEVRDLDRKALLAYVLVCTVWGSTYLVIRIGVEHLPPLLFAGLRHLIASLFLGAFVLWRGLPRPATWGEAAYLGAGGLLFMTISNGSVVWAEQFVPSGIASVYVVTVVIWTALADSLIPGGQGRITARVLVGLALGFLGALLLVGRSVHELLTADLRGPLALMAASMSWAIGTVLMKRRRTRASPFTVAAMQMFVGGSALVVLGLFRGEAPRFHLDAAGAGSMAYLIFAGSIVGFGAYAYALRHMSPTALGTYAYVNPVVAVLMGWGLGHEPITGRMLVAMALMLGAAALIQFGDLVPLPRALGSRSTRAPAAPDAAP